VATQVKEGDLRAADELAALRDAIGKTTYFAQLRAFPQTYAAMATKVKDGDPRAADELAAPRAAIGKTTDFAQLRAFPQTYAAMATKLTEGDPRAADVLAPAAGRGLTGLPRHIVQTRLRRPCDEERNF
jgi:hypothetical protein